MAKSNTKDKNTCTKDTYMLLYNKNISVGVDMQKLQVFIDLLTKNRRLHISVCDISGILNTPLTELKFESIIHSKPFCGIAKSTDKGYRTCLRCKRLANTKAVNRKEPFCGYCPYGLYEAVVPVIVNGSTAAIVYVGNAVTDNAKALLHMKKTCLYTGVDLQRLADELMLCESIEDTSELTQIAELVADYLRLLYKNAPQKEQKLNWLVSLMKRYADEMYCTSISLNELAIACRKNEKYLGRLFKKETGKTFNEYCVQLRLNKAEKLLLQSNERIIDIAFDCGFNNISYFNRLFKSKHGISPKEYRIKNERQ